MSILKIENQCVTKLKFPVYSTKFCTSIGVLLKESTSLVKGGCIKVLISMDVSLGGCAKVLISMVIDLGRQ